jgi:hypothetical protein
MADIELANLDMIFKKFKPNTVPRIFVETGTYRGDSTSVCADKFHLTHTIDLSQEWYEKAKERFKNNKNVFCHLGDSPRVLAQLLPSIDEPILFFLDAHYAGVYTAKGTEENPLLREIKVISEREYRDIIIIDDANLFGRCQEGGGGNPYYPPFMLDWKDVTSGAIKENLRNKKSNFFYEINHKQLLIFTNQSLFSCFIFRIKFISAKILTSGKLRLKIIIKKFNNISGLRKKE